MAAGLHHAHERKAATGDRLEIVHRDVTPSNIMLSWKGEVKLLDFGIAQANNRAAETQSGTIKGKFAYMSPEQCRGKGIDRRTDVFALGIVLYELTTQRRCFRTDSDFETMDRIVKGRIVTPTSFDPRYPPELEAILLKAMALDPDQRYLTAEAFRQALAAYAPRLGPVATAADVAACLRDGIARIAQIDREVLQLWAWEQLEPAEIAKVLGISANAVSIRLHRAKKRLRERLTEVADREPVREEGFAT